MDLARISTDGDPYPKRLKVWLPVLLFSDQHWFKTFLPFVIAIPLHFLIRKIYQLREGVIFIYSVIRYTAPLFQTVLWIHTLFLSGDYLTLVAALFSLKMTSLGFHTFSSKVHTKAFRSAPPEISLSDERLQAKLNTLPVCSTSVCSSLKGSASLLSLLLLLLWFLA